MAEPTSAATATIVGSAAAVPVLKLFGVPLGLQPELLIAGFGGAIAAMSLLNSVPSMGDTAVGLLHTTLKRVGVACGSALTAGYLVPVGAAFTETSTAVLSGVAFIVGAGAQQFLRFAIDKTMKKAEPPNA